MARIYKRLVVLLVTLYFAGSPEVVSSQHLVHPPALRPRPQAPKMPDGPSRIAEPIRPQLPERTEAEGVASLQKANAALTAMLLDVKSQFEHYDAQAKTYDRILLVMKIAVLLCSIGAAAALALSATDFARKAALILSILAAAIPAADQIFQIAAIQRISWRTSVDISRLFISCRDSLESDSESVAAEARGKSVWATVAKCRAGLDSLVDKEMDVSLKTLELPTKIEPK